MSQKIKESFKFELSLNGKEKTEWFEISEWDIDPEIWQAMDDNERSELIESKLEEWKDQWVADNLDKWIKRNLEATYK